MALSVRELRRRIADGLTAALGHRGWLESRYPPELFGQDTREQRHLGFSVAVPSTVPEELDRQNSRRGATLRGAVASTATVIRWGHRLRVVDTVEDYDEALASEAVLVEALLDIDRDPGLAIRIVRLDRQVLPGDEVLLLGQITVSTLHRMLL